ncbi:MAG TPA: hypothetical protein VN688_34100 [Gemmataceae bacterium]|nr:hypothetical protein [Gemmataceae bacterium]
MHDTRKRIRSQARPALVWTLLFFLGGHLLLSLYLYRRHPECCDPEFTLRLRNLQERLAEKPGQPWVLALGSSRIAFGLRPASVMAQMTGEDPQPLLFNFAILGGGPITERMVLHRLLERGERPKLLFVEVWPPFLTQGPFAKEEDLIFRHDVYWSDVPTLARLYQRRGEAVGRLLAETVTPLLHHRVGVLDRYAPDLVPPTLLLSMNFNDHVGDHLDGSGWLPYNLDQPDVVPPSEHARNARRVTQPLFDHFHVNDLSRYAMDEMLQECRTHDIQVVFLLMPDHSLLRSWYPSMQTKLTTYLRQLSEEYHAPVIDARAWQADEDIPDCCHLSRRAAHAFSERFGREVYRPLLQGRPLAKDILLCDPTSK